MVKILPANIGRASLMAQRVKTLPAIQETRVWSLGWGDPLEKEMATNSSIPAWRIPRTEEPGRLQSIASQRVGHEWVTNNFTFTFQCREYGFDPCLRRITHAKRQLSACATTAESAHLRAHALQKENPLQWEVHAPQLKNSPHSPQMERAHVQQRKPSAVKNE